MVRINSPSLSHFQQPCCLSQNARVCRYPKIHYFCKRPPPVRQEKKGHRSASEREKGGWTLLGLFLVCVARPFGVRSVFFVGCEGNPGGDCGCALRKYVLDCGTFVGCGCGFETTRRRRCGEEKVRPPACDQIPQRTSQHCLPTESYLPDTTMFCNTILLHWNWDIGILRQFSPLCSTLQTHASLDHSMVSVLATECAISNKRVA